MKLFLDSLRRAVGNCFLPQVIGLSLLPLLIVGGAELAWTVGFWQENVRGVHEFLAGIPGLGTFLHWLATWFGPSFTTVVDSLIVIMVATPIFVVLVLIVAALWTSPMAVSLVSRRRFPALERRHGGSWFKGLGVSLRHTAVALALSLVTLPLWIVPPLGLLLPTAIWGRMAARVMAFDALAEHATVAERRALLAAHAWPLLMMGMATGLLCSTPSLLWVVSIQAVILFPFVMVGVLWIYTLIFTFSALWFTHYALAALAALRAAEQAAAVAVRPGGASAAGELPLVDEVPPGERFARPADDAGAP